MARAAISEADKASVRAMVFNHLAGIALVPTAHALAARGVFDILAGAEGGWTDLDEIIARVHANRGYMRVALRLLASAGWLTQRVDRNCRFVAYSVTEAGRTAMALAPPLLYRAVASFLPKRSSSRTRCSEPPKNPCCRR